MKVEQGTELGTEWYNVPAFKGQRSSYVSSFFLIFFLDYYKVIKVTNQIKNLSMQTYFNRSVLIYVVSRLSLVAVTIHHPRSSCVM